MAIGSRRDDRTYRADIDGMRAIAILSVVLYHAGIPLIRGGFTGVDMFFVISGYLIGGHIFADLSSGKFSYLDFYLRRARRILPAFYTVLAFSIVVALFLLSPSETIAFGKDALAATLSALNVRLWRMNGLYFQTASELNPLAMTWSLGVEEQFYAVIPFLMTLAVRVRKSLLLPSILVLSAFSLLLSSVELGKHPAFVFYMLPARAWELGVGVALAVFESSRKGTNYSASMTRWLSVTGFALMLVPTIALAPAMPFPGLTALPSVLGAAFIIAVPSSWINRRVLSCAPLVWIGKISYSWYLWHWPILVFLRLCCPGEVPRNAVLLAIAASLAAASLSYSFVEQPFRRSIATQRRLVVGYAGAGLLALAVCSSFLAGRGFPQRFQMASLSEDGRTQLVRDPCLADFGKQDANNLPACNDVSGGRQGIALWGDSHAAALAPGLREAATRGGYAFAQFSKAGCPPLIGASLYSVDHPSAVEECAHFNRQVLALAEGDPAIRIVALDAYWELPFLKSNKYWLTDEAGTSSQRPSFLSQQSMLMRSLRDVVHDLHAAGKQVVVFQGTPAFGSDPLWKRKTALIPLRRDLAMWMGQDASDSAYAPAANAEAAETVAGLIAQSVQAEPGTTPIDLMHEFCASRSRCEYRLGDEMLFVDNDHLSTEGARYALRGLKLPAMSAQRKDAKE